jgi:hypothetical protein
MALEQQQVNVQELQRLNDAITMTMDALRRVVPQLAMLQQQQWFAQQQMPFGIGQLGMQQDPMLAAYLYHHALRSQQGIGGYGPQLGGFGPQLGGFGPQLGAYGPQLGAYGPQLGAYGPQLGAYGPQLGGYGQISPWQQQQPQFGIPWQQQQPQFGIPWQQPQISPFVNLTQQRPF